MNQQEIREAVDIVRQKLRMANSAKVAIFKIEYILDTLMSYVEENCEPIDEDFDMFLDKIWENIGYLKNTNIIQNNVDVKVKLANELLELEDKCEHVFKFHGQDVNGDVRKCIYCDLTE